MIWFKIKTLIDPCVLKLTILKKIDLILQFNDFVVQPHLVMAVVVVTGWVGGGDGGCGLKVKEVMAVECEFDVAMAIGWCQQCCSGIG